MGRESFNYADRLLIGKAAGLAVGGGATLMIIGEWSIGLILLFSGCGIFWHLYRRKRVRDPKP